MGIIFRKTPKGIAEIETRAHRLVPRMRSALILVDGRRSTDELRTLISVQCEESLKALHDQGFIEMVGSVETPAPSTTPGSSTTTATPARPSIDHRLVQREAVRLLTEQVGPAADALAMRIEKARSLEELRPLVGHAAQLVSSLRGQAAGAAFLARFRGL